ncbi:MAG: putative reverse transcriptase [Streblomastix strix]|uniref:Putative reverse transcriptase n=1 Tax=Streblomastix strix TaxID=222440 RepID=A0A5J4WX14_9EUKA|nr:MAG: putative reverse transcriptase [Streblomastix strix]
MSRFKGKGDMVDKITNSRRKGKFQDSILNQNKNRIFTLVFRKGIKSCILNVSNFMYIIGQSNRFLQQANVRIEITSTATNCQNGYEQSGIEGYDLGSIALKDQSRASGDLGSQCQEGQSYDIGAGQQQAQPCRPASQLTLELTDESKINSQSGKIDDFIPIQADQQQKDRSNHQTDLRVGKHTVEQTNAIKLKETYKQICSQAYINISWSLESSLELRSVINRQNQTTELPSGSTRYQQYLAYSSIRDYSNQGQADPLYPSLVTDWSRSINLKRDQGLLDISGVPRDIEKEQIEVHPNKVRDSLRALDQLIDQEVQEQIVGKVTFEDLARVNPCFAIPKSDPANWRKITDCSILNRFLRTNHFIMEDINTVREILLPNDWMIKTDLQSAFHHILVDPEFRPFLRFYHRNRYYQYKAMCFEVRHAPLIFHKTLRPVMKLIKQKLEVRGASYCDYLILLCQNRDELEIKKQNILQILCEFGWKISEDKSSFQPTQEIEFLRLQINSRLNQIMISNSRRQKMLNLIGRWKRKIHQRTLVKVKFQASFIDQLNFFRLKIKRGDLHMKKVEQVEAKSSDYQSMEKQDVSGQDHIVRSILVEEQDRVEQTDQSHSVATTSHLNNRRISRLIGCNTQNQSQQVEDMVLGQQKQSLEINKQQLERICCRSLRVTPFSTFLERAAGTVTKNRNRQQIYCNIRSGRGLVASNSCISHPWQVEYDSRFSFQTCHIGRFLPQRRNLTRGIDNVKDKTIDRYVLQSPQQKVQEICQPVAGQMGCSPGLSLNIMATRRTVSTPSYPSDTANSKQTNGREGISSDDSMILAISTVVACTHEDDIKIDYLMRKRRRLSPRGKKRKQKKHLPPGRMMAVLLEVTEEKNYSDGFLFKEILPALLSRTSQAVVMRLGEGIVKDQGNLMNIRPVKGKQEKIY